MEKIDNKTTEILAYVAEKSKRWTSQGKDALANLKALGSANLPKGDEIIIAKNIFSEYSNLKSVLKEKKVKISEFCEKAGLGDAGSYSKELHRLMLSPGEDPEKKRVRKSANKYLWLLQAMAEVYCESPVVLANKLLMNTSLHPTKVEFWKEIDLIQAMLEAIVNKVDQEFNLFSTYKETALLKAEHAQHGGVYRWPHGDVDWRMLFTEPYPQTEYSKEDVQREIAIAQDVRFSYWAKPLLNSDISSAPGQESACWIDDDFFYIPHVYLGYGAGLFFEMNFLRLQPCDKKEQRTHSLNQINQALDQFKKEAMQEFERCGKNPDDDWDTVNEKPMGQDSSLEEGGARWHAWLIAYPSPDNTRILPILLIPCEEGGPFLMPLDARGLAVLDGNYWIDPDGSVEKFLDRLKRMLKPGENQEDLILAGLRRTAPWLKKNPFMKMKEKKDRELNAMQEHFKNLISK